MKIKTILLNRVLLPLLALSLAACASLPSDFKEPGVSLLSIRPQIGNPFAPEFDVQLQVTNPNRRALEIIGISYSIQLQGNNVIEGVARELPIIPAYGEANVGLHAILDLAGGLSLLGDLLDRPGGQIDYELNADIDLGRFYPMVRVRRNGVILLR